MGAATAARDLETYYNAPHRRTVLITGDGCLQLTIQEIGNMVFHGLKPVIIIINNAGYTIERAIHGAQERYNDIVPINYAYLPYLFKCKDPEKSFRCASTRAELEIALKEPALKDPQQLEILEIRMDKLDIPWRLARFLMKMVPGKEDVFQKEGFTYAA